MTKSSLKHLNLFLIDRACNRFYTIKIKPFQITRKEDIEMMAMIWRFLVAVFDWRTIWRKLNGCPAVDVVFITNMRDDVDRRRYLSGRLLKGCLKNLGS